MLLNCSASFFATVSPTYLIPMAKTKLFERNFFRCRNTDQLNWLPIFRQSDRVRINLLFLNHINLQCWLPVYFLPVTPLFRFLAHQCSWLCAMQNVLCGHYLRFATCFVGAVVRTFNFLPYQSRCHIRATCYIFNWQCIYCSFSAKSTPVTFGIISPLRQTQNRFRTNQVFQLYRHCATMLFLLLYLQAPQVANLPQELWHLWCGLPDTIRLIIVWKHFLL